MSKARVSWAFQERPVSSSKMNQANTDYMTPGVPIWSYFYRFQNDSGVNVGAGPLLGGGFYPYNPQKSVYDRLYLIGAAFNGASEESDEFDLTFDGGATWTPAFPSAAAAPITILSTTVAETWNLDVQVATFQWIGWRWAGGGVSTGTAFVLGLQGFLYRSTDTPF
jgi:hypothetical protein